MDNHVNRGAPLMKRRDHFMDIKVHRGAPLMKRRDHFMNNQAHRGAPLMKRPLYGTLLGSNSSDGDLVLFSLNQVNGLGQKLKSCKKKLKVVCPSLSRCLCKMVAQNTLRGCEENQVFRFFSQN